MIMRGELKCGEKLPSERELAEKFNVSRVPIREALENFGVYGHFGDYTRRWYLREEHCLRGFAG
ncbi:MAG: winged helix-turn-helix domain-containing protein [Oscillospiraceae bacterium]